MSDTELALLGWPENGPTLRLDYRRFSYAGKFVMSSTGKAVVRTVDAAGEGARTSTDEDEHEGDVDDWDDGGSAGDADDENEEDTDDEDEKDADDGDGAEDEYDADVLAAVAFNEDRTDPSTLWLRYVTVRDDRRGDGLGPRLVQFVTDRARERGYVRVRIAVNNPYSYEALYRAGFGFTGRETGIAELVLERPGDDSPERYRAGLDLFAERDDLTDDEERFLAEKRDRGPPGDEPGTAERPDEERHH